MVSVKISDAARARAYSAKALRIRVTALCQCCGASGPRNEQQLGDGWTWEQAGPREWPVCPVHTQAFARQRRVEALTLRDTPGVYGQMAGD